MTGNPATGPLTYSAPNGPHPVGVCDGEFTDSVYPPVRAQEADGRRCSVRVWYPAASAQGRRRRYFSDAEMTVAGLFMSGEPPRVPTSWMHRLGELVTYSVTDAPPAKATFPTLIFSHGLGSYLGQNVALMEHLASHGYVVIGLGHPGEAGGLEYPDGSVATFAEDFTAALADLASNPGAMERVTGDVPTRLASTRLHVDGNALGPWSRRWVDDTRALIDALEEAAVTGLPPEVLALCDLKRIGVFGMSFGAAAAASTAQADARVQAVVNLDGGQSLSDLLDTDIRLPLLELTHDALAMWNGMGIATEAVHYNEFFFEPLATTGTREDVVRLCIPDIAHMELMDLSFFPPEERAQAIRGGGLVDSDRLNAIMNTFIGAYFDYVLKSVSNGYPKAQLDEFPELKKVDLSPLRDWAAQQ
jgi:hypothetical protein